MMKRVILFLSIAALASANCAKAYVPPFKPYIGLSVALSPDVGPHDNKSDLVRDYKQNFLPTTNFYYGGAYAEQARTWEGIEANLFYARPINYHFKNGDDTKLRQWGWRMFATAGVNLVGNLNLVGGAGFGVVEQDIGSEYSTITSLRPAAKLGLTYIMDDRFTLTLFDTYTYGQALTHGDPLATNSTYMMNDVSLGINYFI